MSHFETYLQYIRDSEGRAGSAHVHSIESVSSEFIKECIIPFKNTHSEKVLLLGEVQSGKTSQILGVIAKTADVSPLFTVFILLTSSNIALYRQTLTRALESLTSFVVCGEHDSLRLKANAGKQPVLIILKKNRSVLKKWRNELRNQRLIESRPLFIIDDEADATGLNTLVNQGGQSAINLYLEELNKVASSSVYLQVTATPEALLLQSDASGWRPQKTIYFDPGEGYVGGGFFFSDPPPFAYKQTAERELALIVEGWSGPEDLPLGLREAVSSYLVASAHKLKSVGGITSFLIHPSWSQDSHAIFQKAVNELLDYFKGWRENPNAGAMLRASWDDLQRSQPDLIAKDVVLEFVESSAHGIHVLNSAKDASSVVEMTEGSYIIIGGNSLGRGVTLPMLLTTYYCRQSRMPQMDTMWQHCRMFGYDRIAGLSRMFMPGSLYNLFAETYSSTRVLVDLVKAGESKAIQVLSVAGLRPTRRNVVDDNYFDRFVGGVNYFPPFPDQKAWAASRLDEYIDGFGRDDFESPLNKSDFMEVLSRFESSSIDEWDTGSFVRAVESWSSHREAKLNPVLIVRRNRDVSRGTGTLLSPNDRDAVAGYVGRPVLVLYRLNGSIDNRWDGVPFWIPNVKLPERFVFNFTR